MTSLSKPSILTQRADHADCLHEWVVAQICPFFLGGAPDNPALAAEAARQLLVGYDAVTAQPPLDIRGYRRICTWERRLKRCKRGCSPQKRPVATEQEGGG